MRHRIKQLIEGESADNVFSDDTIVEKLRESGIAIARRTVAKYREAMRIPSSVQRRRDKQPGPGTVKVRGDSDAERDEHLRIGGASGWLGPGE